MTWKMMLTRGESNKSKWLNKHNDPRKRVQIEQDVGCKTYWQTVLFLARDVIRVIVFDFRVGIELVKNSTRRHVAIIQRC